MDVTQLSLPKPLPKRNSSFIAYLPKSRRKFLTLQCTCRISHLPLLLPLVPLFAILMLLLTLISRTGCYQNDQASSYHSCPQITSRARNPSAHPLEI